MAIDDEYCGLLVVTMMALLPASHCTVPIQAAVVGGRIFCSGCCNRHNHPGHLVLNDAFFHLGYHQADLDYIHRPCYYFPFALLWVMEHWHVVDFHHVDDDGYG